MIAGFDSAGCVKLRRRGTRPITRTERRTECAAAALALIEGDL
jgi:hypothetical protein